MNPRLLDRYTNEILPALAERCGRTNRLSLPRLDKIVINMGVGAASAEKKCLEEAVDALRFIAGQQPIVTLARKSIAGFRLREGMSIGCKVGPLPMLTKRPLDGAFGVLVLLIFFCLLGFLVHQNVM